jgi:membrane associated rhomboid family serine protease
MTSTQVGMRFPECVRQRTKVKTIRSVEEPLLTYGLIGANVLVAAGLAFGGGSGGEFGNNQLYDLGALSRETIADGEYWRLLTNGFIHGTGQPSSVLLHLLFNMFGLYILGGLLEPALGRRSFALLYVVSVLAGAFGALLLEPDRTVAGASGAVFGLMGAAIFVMRHRGINPMESGLGLWLGLNLLITFTYPGLSIGGHLGGLVGGAVAAFFLFGLGDRVRLPRALPTALTVLLGVAVVGGSIAVSSAAG